MKKFNLKEAMSIDGKCLVIRRRDNQIYDGRVVCTDQQTGHTTENLLVLYKPHNSTDSNEFVLSIPKSDYVTEYYSLNNIPKTYDCWIIIYKESQIDVRSPIIFKVCTSENEYFEFVRRIDSGVISSAKVTLKQGETYHM